MQINLQYGTVRKDMWTNIYPHNPHLYLTIVFILMWLFDNLFLDQNTRVTINDGIDHSKDSVVDIVQPLVSLAEGQTPEAILEIPTGDGNLAGLFDSDAKEDAAAEAILHPEPPKDIALEIGMGATLPSDPAVSFDIGWDVYFDIGWEVGTGDIASMTQGSISGEVSAPLDLVLWSLDLSQEVSSLEGTKVDIKTPEWVVPVIEILQTPEVASADNALFSLLNEDTPATDKSMITSWTPESIDTMSSEVWVIQDTPLVTTSDDILGWLLGQSRDIPPVSSEIFTKEDSTSENSIPVSIASLGSYESSVSPVSALTTLTGSPKLKDKLSKFINELESMELEDQSEKNHKRQQIEMYRTRIQEIKAEYDMRIRALELEERELEKQIGEMDEEKNRIRNVLTTFQKELQSGGNL